jgi:hypothetical protein
MILGVLNRLGSWQINETNKQKVTEILNICGELVEPDKGGYFPLFYTLLLARVSKVMRMEEESDKYWNRIEGAVLQLQKAKGKKRQKIFDEIDKIRKAEEKNEKLSKIRKVGKILFELYHPLEKIKQDFENKYYAKLKSLKERFQIKETKLK